MDIFRLDNKVALVTGGGSGIGRAIALGLASSGAFVIAAGRSPAKLRDTVKLIGRAGNEAAHVVMDVRSGKDVERAVERLVRQFGRIDVLVNSAGAHVKVDSMDMTGAEWDRVMETNLKGLFFVCQSVGRRMRESGGGSIVNISSINGITPFPNTLAYCVSKSGVIMLTKSLAADWAVHGIRVNAIAPGVVPTDLNREALKAPGRKARIIKGTAMGRVGSADEMIGAAVFLASGASSYVTGETIAVDGGFLAKGI